MWKTSLYVLKIENIICLLNICGATDGTHIPFIYLLNEILLHVLFFNRKKFQNIALQVVCDIAHKIFWNICVGQPRKVHNGDQFKTFNLYV
jgi:hypothetical protein